MADSEVHRAVSAVWRIEAPRVIATLTRFVRDVGRAEELAQEAFVAALERWPETGIPENPGAWLVTTAKHRAIDEGRRQQMLARKHDELAGDALAFGADHVAAPDADDDTEGAGDDLLRLVLIACHPALSAEARVALTLRVVGGLGTDEIARAYLVPEATIAQRIVRAKRTLAEARAAFEVPSGPGLTARLASALQVVYLIFNEGYTATSGAEWMRPELCEEALRLGRVLTTLAPDDAEVHGLVALMELQASRTRARVGEGGAPVLLLDQDRARWDRLLIGRGLAALARAERLAPAPGPYTLQAAIAACHARAATPGDTDWERIAALYAALGALTPSPIIELNRAVALGMARGPAAGLGLVDALVADGALAAYHPLHAVRGDFLAKLGRAGEARAALEHAAALTQNERERAVLLARAGAL